MASLKYILWDFCFKWGLLDLIKKMLLCFLILIALIGKIEQINHSIFLIFVMNMITIISMLWFYTSIGKAIITREIKPYIAQGIKINRLWILILAFTFVSGLISILIFSLRLIKTYSLLSLTIFLVQTSALIISAKFYRALHIFRFWLLLLAIPLNVLYQVKKIKYLQNWDFIIALEAINFWIFIAMTWTILTGLLILLNSKKIWDQISWANWKK